jgi:hypothetical protein
MKNREKNKNLAPLQRTQKFENTQLPIPRFSPNSKNDNEYFNRGHLHRDRKMGKKKELPLSEEFGRELLVG